MATLSLRVPLGVGETAASFCSRLALRNGCKSATELCRDMGFQLLHVVAGRQGTLARLAQLGGVRLDAVSRNTVRRTARGYACRDQVLLLPTIDRSRLRVCPRCLLEDRDRWPSLRAAAPYHRSAWTIAPIQTCTVHAVELVEIMDAPALSKCSLNERHDFSTLVTRCLPDLTLAATNTRPREATALERYLTARLDGTSPAAGTWLDDMPFYAVARACEMVGIVVTKGTAARLSTYTWDDWRVAGGVGFSIMVDGPERLTAELLALLQVDVPGYGSGPRAYLGELYRWLDKSHDDTAYDQLRHVVRESVLNSFAFGPEETILGSPVGARRFHSVHQIFEDTRIHFKRLKNTLYAAGLISEADLGKTNDKIIFPANDQSSAFLEKLLTAVPQNKTASYLGMTRCQFELYLEHGLIPALVEKIGPIKDRGFAKADLDAFLARLEARVTRHVEQPLPNFVPLPKAAKYAHVSSVPVLQLLLDGGLKEVHRLTTINGLAAILIDKKEVRAILRPPVDVGLSFRQAAIESGWSRHTLEALAKHGFLKSEIAPNPVTGIPQRVIQREVLAAFLRDHVSLFELAKLHNTAMKTIAEKIKRRGIPLAFPKELVGISILNRDQIGMLDN